MIRMERREWKRRIVGIVGADGRKGSCRMAREGDGEVVRESCERCWRCWSFLIWDVDEWLLVSVRASMPIHFGEAGELDSMGYQASGTWYQLASARPLKDTCVLVP